MTKITIGFLVALQASRIIAVAQPVSIVNDACFGGSQTDVLTRMNTPDGVKLVMAGESYSSNGNLGSNSGIADGWILMVDGNNGVVYSSSTGGPGFDEINSIEVISGGSTVAFGTASGVVGAVNCITNNGSDLLLAQADLNGNLVQQKCLGGQQDDFAAGIIIDPYAAGSLQYIITGHTMSSDTGMFSGLTNMGFLDIFVAKTDSLFNILDIRLIQSSGFDLARSIIPVGNGDFLLMGESDGNDGDMAGTSPNGSDDVMVFKLDYNLNILGKYRYGGSWVEHAFAFHADQGGFIVGGGSASPGFAGCTAGSGNGFVFKCNASGIIQWITCIEGSGSEYVRGGILSSNGNAFLVIGESESNDLDFSNNQGGMDAFLAGIDYNSGSLDWTFTYGGTNYDGGFMLIETSGNQLVTINYTDSNNGDITCLQNGQTDAWLVRFNNYTGVANESGHNPRITLAPVPSRDFVDIGGIRGCKGVLKIRNILGETVHTLHLNSQERIRLDISSLVPGVYFIEISDPRLHYSGKLIRIN